MELHDLHVKIKKDTYKKLRDKAHKEEISLAELVRQLLEKCTDDKK